MDIHSMEVFAEVRREGILEEAEMQRLLKAARSAQGTGSVAGEPRWGAIGRGLAWLTRLARPGRPAAAP